MLIQTCLGDINIFKSDMHFRYIMVRFEYTGQSHTCKLKVSLDTAIRFWSLRVQSRGNRLIDKFEILRTADKNIKITIFNFKP